MNKDNAILKILFTITFVFYGMFVCIIPVRADMGAKPSIDLTVLNAPESYYVALLTNWATPEERGVPNVNSKLKLEEVNDESVVEYLKGFLYDGWFYHETPVGQSYFRSNAENRYCFDYKVPNPFKVIIIDADGEVYISDVLDQVEFNAECVYDMAAGTLEENRTNQVLGRISYVAGCYVITLVVEGIILKLFRYPFTKRNVFSFLFINTVTNIPLNHYLVYGSLSGIAAAFFILFFWPLIEVAIMLIEGAFYAYMLRDRDGKNRVTRGFVYSLVANIASATMSFIIPFILSAYI